jgi:hypothetical protein
MTTSPPATPDAAPDGERYVLAPDVILVPVPDGSVRLLDMGGSFYAVPAVGAEMLQETLGGGTGSAARRVAERYGVDVRQVRADQDAFLRDLRKKGLIRPARMGRQRRPGMALPHLTLAPALWLASRAGRGHLRTWLLLALSRLSFLLFGWARTLAVWRRWFPLKDTRLSAEEMEGRAAAVDEAVRRSAACHPFRIDCKERALCCWALARAAGVPAALVVGVQLFPLAGHCWCEFGARLLGDDRDRCEDYQVVARYD